MNQVAKETATADSFPWAPQGPLCPVLRNPRLWASSFPHPATSVIREHFLSAYESEFSVRLKTADAKKKLVNDSSFGTMAVRVMDDPHSRKTLAERFEGSAAGEQFSILRGELYSSFRQLLTVALLSYASTEFLKDRRDTPALPIPQDRNHKRPAESYRSWLESDKSQNCSFETMALWTSVGALCFPNQRDEILAVALEVIPELSTFLLQPSVDPARSKTATAQSAPIQEIDEVTRSSHGMVTNEQTTAGVSSSDQAAMVDSDPASDEMNRSQDKFAQTLQDVSVTLDDNEYWKLLSLDSYRVSVDHLKDGIKTLESILKSRTEPLNQLDATCQKLRSELAEVTNSELIENTPHLDQLLQLDVREMLSDAQPHLSHMESQTQEIIQSYRQVRRIANQLNIDVAGRAKASELDQLKHEILLVQHDLTEQLKEVSRRERRIVEFVDFFARGDDRQRRALLLEEATSSFWEDFGTCLVSGKLRTTDDSDLGSLSENMEFIGVLVFYLWTQQPELAPKLIAKFFANQEACRRNQQSVALQLLSVPQLLAVAKATPSSATLICECLVALAYRHQRVDWLFEVQHLMPKAANLSRAESALMTLILKLSRKGRLPELVYPLPNINVGLQVEDQIALIRSVLLERTLKTSTRKGAVRISGETIETLYFEPLQTAIRTADVNLAITIWQSNGNIDEMLSRTNDKSKSNGNKATTNVRLALAEFDAYLRRWMLLADSSQSQDVAWVQQAIQDVVNENPLSNFLGFTGNTLQTEFSWMPDDFANSISQVNSNSINLHRPTELVNPLMINCWPKYLLEKQIGIDDFFIDSFAKSIPSADVLTIEQAIDKYLERHEYVAALEAARSVESKSLETQVRNSFIQLRDEIEGEYSAVLAVANSTREDPEIVELLNEIEGAFKALRVNTARESLQLLQLAVADHQQKLDELRKGAEDRQWHLIEMKLAIEDPWVPESLREQLLQLAAEFDCPSAWPEKHVSEQLARVLETFFRFLRGRLEPKDEAAECNVVSHIIKWLPDTLRSSLETAGAGPEFSLLLEVSEAINVHRADPTLLRLMGHANADLSPPSTAVRERSRTPKLVHERREIKAPSVQRKRPSTSGELPSVFISYAREDSDFVKNLAENLKIAEIASWFDAHIDGGAAWEREIEKRIRSAGTVVYVLSQHSVDSEFVRKELRFATNCGKTVIPVRLDDCVAPISLSDVQHIDVRKSNAAIGDLIKLLKSKPELVEAKHIAESRDLISRDRQLLRQFMEQEESIHLGQARSMAKAVANGAWREARQRAAKEMLSDKKAIPEDKFDELEIIYTVARLHAPDADVDDKLTELLRIAVIGVIQLELDPRAHILGSEVCDSTVLSAFATTVLDHDFNGIQSVSLQDTELLKEVILELNQSDETRAAKNWFYRLLAQLRVVRRGELRGDMVIVDQLWDGAAGTSDSVMKVRCALLELLYRTQAHADLLRHLLKKVKDDRFNSAISVCLGWFERIDVVPDARDNALRCLLSLWKARTRVKNSRPWMTFLQLLAERYSEADGEVLDVALESESLGANVHGEYFLEVRFRPQGASAIQNIAVQVGTQSQESAQLLLQDGEALLEEKVFPLRVPSSAVAQAGDVFEIPYRITYDTANQGGLDLRSEWILQRLSQRYEPLTNQELLDSWPGTSGTPVANAQFYGREQLLSEIIDHLSRWRGVMIHGQRKIGKTSLLGQLLERFGNRDDKTAGVFTDIPEVLPREHGEKALNKAVFRWTLNSLKGIRYCEPIRSRLYQASGFKFTDDLIERFKPESSLYHALEGLVDLMREKSNGSIERVFFFYDEFHRFVQLALKSDRQADIRAFTSELQSILDHSRKVSLVLAGSGIQKLLVKDYSEPLFGRIEEKELGPLDWKTERTAIEDIVLPGPLRERLCPNRVQFDAMARRAFELTSGIPYYLALLGKYAAEFSSGHPLTPALLSRSMNTMLETRSSLFYEAVSHTLQSLPNRDRVNAAKLLVLIACDTSPTYPSIGVDAVLKSEAIGFSVSLSDKRRALNLLEDCKAVEFDNRQRYVKVAVPIVAEAIRKDEGRIIGDLDAIE